MKRVAALLVALVLVLGAAPASARRVRLACTDGDAACDRDARCNGRCVFRFCRVLCLVPPCPDVFSPCASFDAERLVEVPLRRGGKAAGRQRVSLGDGLHAALRCVPPGRDACKPPLTTGCRADLPRDACEAHAGEFAQRGLLPEPRCQCRTEDAGAPCQRGLDCQGQCLVGSWATAPQCSAHLIEFGCFTEYDDAGEPRAVCYD